MVLTNKYIQNERNSYYGKKKEEISQVKEKKTQKEKTMKLISARSLLLTSFFLFFILFFVNKTYAWSSTYFDWQYRKEITITEQSGNTLTDYQVMLTIDTASLISQGKMNSDCSDIRFTDENDNPLSYWIESGCNSANTKIWVKVPNISASSTATIYMYYGNPSASSESNGDAVFEFFDDFEGTSLDTDKWTVRGSFDSLTVSNGILHLEGGGNWEYIKTKQNWTDTILMRAYIKRIGKGSGLVFSESTNDNRYTTTSDQAKLLMTQDSDVSGFNSLIDCAYPGLSISLGVWYTEEAIVTPEGDGITFYRYCLDSSCNSATKTFTNVDINYLSFGFSSYSNSDPIEVDWIGVRKYTEPEPTYSLGTEENQPPQITIYEPQNTTYYTNDLEFKFKVTDYSLYTEAGGDVRDGLVLNLHFDENSGTTAYDTSGNGNDGTYYGETFNDGTIYGATWTNGKHGKALSFDGVDDYVEVPHSDGLDITGPFTFAVWVYPKTMDDAGDIVAERISHNSIGILFSADASQGIRFGGSFYPDANKYTFTPTYYPFNNWYFVVVTQHYAEGMKIYVNGELVYERTDFTGNNTLSDSVKIGFDEFNTYFNGIIDEVRIYNRSLSEDEIKAIYENNTFMRDGLVAYWRFDEGSGNTAYDTHHIAYPTNKDGTKFLNALSFDGVDDYVEVPHSDSLEGMEKITISMWAKWVNKTTPSEQWLYRNPGCYGLRQMNGIINYIVIYGQNATVYINPNYEIIEGEWHNFVIVYDSVDKTLDFYVDGLLHTHGTNKDGGLVGASSYNLLIGAYSDAHYFFNGTIDEVRIYNRALSDEEIQKLYEMQLAKYHVKAYLNDNLIYEDTSYQNNTEITLNLQPYITQSDSYYVKVWANDTDSQSPQTSEETVYFTVGEYNIEEIDWNSNVYETSTQNYYVLIRYNPDLVDSFGLWLNWNGTDVAPFGCVLNGTHAECNASYTIPLIQSEVTVDWYAHGDVNYKNGTVGQLQSVLETQNLKYAYVISDFTLDSSNYVEKTNATATMTLTTNENKATITGYVLFGNNEYVMDKLDYNTYYKEIELPEATTNTETITMQPIAQICFNGVCFNRTYTNASATLYKIILAKCNATYTSKVLTINLKDELSAALINGSIQSQFYVNVEGYNFTRQYGFSEDNVSTIELCAYPTFVNYETDAELWYSSDGYPQRNYYLVNAKLYPGVPATLDLLLLPEAKGIYVVVQVVDANAQPVEGVIVKVLRYYLDSDTFKTIAVARTGMDGKASIFLQPYEQYKYIVEKNGQVLRETERAELTTNEILIRITEVITVFNYLNNIGYNCELIDNSTFHCVVTDTSNKMKYAHLIVDKITNIANISVTECDKTEFGSGVDIYCNLSNDTSLWYYKLYVSLDRVTEYMIDSGYIGEQTTTNVYGIAGLFAFEMFVLTLTLMEIINPVTSLIFMLLAVGISRIIGLVNVQVGTFGALVAVVSIFIYSRYKKNKL
ncbi:MAG: DUF2341 domain-containing protein [Candidatus Hodarchaeales archaeon]